MTMTQPTMVIGPQFLTTSPLDLIITNKRDASIVTDVNGNVVFKLKRPNFGLSGNLLLLDAAGNTLLTLREKSLSAHNRWKIYRGDSTSDSDLLFSVKFRKKKLDVFLGANTREDVCDFHVEGNQSPDSSCNIYLRDSPDIVAQMHRKKRVPSGLTVYPNVDYAFVVALIVIILQSANRGSAILDGAMHGVGESSVSALFSF